MSEIEGRTLQSTLRKGWYWGGEAFKESLLDKLEQLTGGNLPVAKDFRSSDQARDHALRDGEKILAEAVRHFGMGDGRTEAFKALPRGDLRRVAVAWTLCRRTSLKQTWIADRIGLGTGDNVSAQVRKLSARSKKEIPSEVRAWMERFL